MTARLLFLWVFSVCFSASWLLANEAERTWTSSDGKQIQGALIDYDGEEVQLQVGNSIYKFEVSRLSPEDQKYLKAWMNQPANVKVGEWPDFVGVEDLEVTIVKEDADAKQYVYRSNHFEFRTSARLSTAVVKEFAAIFEATFETVKALPVGFAPKPRESGYYLTELYETRQEYEEAGGPPGSGGVFTSRGNKIMIPMNQLGVSWTGRRWIVEHRDNNDTLKHEITHQVTAEWLPLLPVWFIEGIAEYIAAARYNEGRYMLKNMSGSIEDYAFRYLDQREFPMVGLNHLMTMDMAQWAGDLTTGMAARNYPSSGLLMYYFLHLDGEGKGESVAQFLAALGRGEDPEAAASQFLMRDRDFEALEVEVREKLRQAGIRVEF